MTKIRARVFVFRVGDVWWLRCPCCGTGRVYPPGDSETAIWDAQKHGVTWHPRRSP